MGDRADYFDVKADAVKLDEMLKLSKGVRKVPVIVENGSVAVGYEGGSCGVWGRQGAGQDDAVIPAKAGIQIF